MTTSPAPLATGTPHVAPSLVPTPVSDMGPPLRLRLANEHELVRRGLEAVAADRDDVVVVAANDRSGSEVDLVLLDPPGTALEQRDVARHVWLVRPAKVVLFTWRPSSRLQSIALLGGAAGCVCASSPAEQLLDELHRIRDGEVVTQGGTATEHDSPVDRLTLRERQVIGLVACGASNEQIARRLALSMNTIKTYIRGAYGKIGAECRSQAVIWALEHRCVGRAAGLADQALQEPAPR